MQKKAKGRGRQRNQSSFWGDERSWDQSDFLPTWLDPEVVGTASGGIPFDFEAGPIFFEVFNDGVPDGTDSVVFSLSESDGLGFAKSTYVFREPAAGSQLFSIRLAEGAASQEVTIILLDAGVVPIRLGNQSDRHTGSASDDVVFAGKGDDTVDSKSGNDTLRGQEGNDTLQGRRGNDSLFGEAGNDTLNGSAGNDTLNGGAGNDTLNGGAGNDIIDGMAGRDLLIGGDGKDILLGGAGNDTIYGGPADGATEVNFSSDQELSGGDGNDLIFGGEDADLIFGSDGKDTLFGGGGNDQIFSGDGNDRLDGQDGNDNLIGGDNDDTLLGGAGNDSLTGGLGNDSLSGGEGNDVLSGGGNDTLAGGAGADTFSFFSFDGVATIQDFSRAEGDKIQISKFGTGASLTSQFAYSSATGALTFNGTLVIQLQPGLTFAPAIDLVLL
ncbi:MAG: calcium-binding protein [Cyanobacteriota bacterium]